MRIGREGGCLCPFFLSFFPYLCRVQQQQQQQQWGLQWEKYRWHYGAGLRLPSASMRGKGLSERTKGGRHHPRQLIKGGTEGRSEGRGGNDARGSGGRTKGGTFLKAFQLEMDETDAGRGEGERRSEAQISRRTPTRRQIRADRGKIASRREEDKGRAGASRIKEDAKPEIN